MTTRLLRAALACAACCLSTTGFAQSALVHVQGDEGQREAYYADFAVVLTRTPLDKCSAPPACASSTP